MELFLPDNTPVEGTKVLLHACCAPCSSSVVECMLQNKMLPVVYFCNPNIYPKEEYVVRKEELKRFLQIQNIPYVEDEYDHDAWLERIHGLEREPERGGRCMQCFLMRMERTAQYAARNGFRWFTTTLSSSRWKDMSQIAQAGKKSAMIYPELQFWEQNWRKGGLQQRRAELLRENNFYNQLYCGCEFSMEWMKQKQQTQINK